MTELMLTVEEVERLTGKRQATKQAAWCRRNGVSYRVNDCGEVIVARALGEKYLGVARPAAAKEADLNWPAMHRMRIVGRRGET